MKNNSEPTSIRLPKDLMTKIREDAMRDKRSITKQIEYIIDSYYKFKDIIN